MRHELVCLAPATPPLLQVRSVETPQPNEDEVLVRVAATCVNPIDAKRASGYGHRLLGLKGAAKFPLVLGNDLAGRVEAVGRGVKNFQAGDAVFGLVGTGKRGGAHASQVVVPEEYLRHAPENLTFSDSAVLPYAFTTMWLAIRAVQLTPANAKGKRVLIHGAGGALGRLALQLLSLWGCYITASCRASHASECLFLGAQVIAESGPNVILGLPDDFDVVLNFANWDDELTLASRLGARALGQATSVHPLLGNFDRLGWLGGALVSRRDKRKVLKTVQSRAANASYSWTIFKPDAEALNVLELGARQHQFALPVGLQVRLIDAVDAFAHVTAAKTGRAVLLP